MRQFGVLAISLPDNLNLPTRLTPKDQESTRYRHESGADKSILTARRTATGPTPGWSAILPLLSLTETSECPVNRELSGMTQPRHFDDLPIIFSQVTPVKRWRQGAIGIINSGVGATSPDGQLGLVRVTSHILAFRWQKRHFNAPRHQLSTEGRFTGRFSRA